MNDIPIIAIGYNRADSMKRLLSSLDNAVYTLPVKLYISIDGGGGDEVPDLVNDFEWKHGEKVIIRHKENLGLRNHILSCGDLATNHDGVIVLEDDLVVSPWFYEFSLKAGSFYNNDQKIGGISLYAHSYNETSQFPIQPLDDGSDVFFMQYASSWGQLWTSKGWNDFRSWYSENQDVPIKGDSGIPANIQYWPASSWKKYFISYLIKTDRYFVFPRSSLSTMFSDHGTHMKVKEHFLQVPLQMGPREYSFSTFKNSMAVYDVYGEIIPEVLKKLAPVLKDYDFATDLNAMKPAKTLHNEYLLTTRSVKEAVLSFGREMKPHELNVIHGVPGNDIHLARKKDCTDVPYLRKLLKVHEKRELAYWYPIREYHFSKKKIISTESRTDRSLNPVFLFRKLITMSRYSWRYFFGK